MRHWATPATVALASALLIGPARPVIITSPVPFGVMYHNGAARTVLCTTEVRLEGGRSGYKAQLTAYKAGTAVYAVGANGRMRPLVLRPATEGTRYDVKPLELEARDIALVFHVESTIATEDVQPWIDASISAANALFASQRLGITVSQSDPIESFRLPGGTVGAPTCSTISGESIPDDGKMHVFVTGLVDELLTNGITCSGENRKLAISASSTFGSLPTLLAHEICHNLSMSHPSDFASEAECIPTNVMRTGFLVRTDIAEGQGFSAWTSSSSFLLIDAGALPSLGWAPDPYVSIWSPTTPIP